MIRDFRSADFEGVLSVINDAANAYRGVIPADRFHDPYMSAEALSAEIDAGVVFRVLEEDGRLVGAMGSQPVKDVLLIRHAYIRSDCQGQGFGSALISDLLARASAPVLVGTWAAASWAIGFYRRHRFEQVSEAEKNRLLETYWSIPREQIENSVVLRLISSPTGR
tara:strand:+ start:140 stop:637 length:498 start_codon:yes stop_codon:yes gene_type:complete